MGCVVCGVRSGACVWACGVRSAVWDVCVGVRCKECCVRRMRGACDVRSAVWDVCVVRAM